ncbi:MAG: lysophospholipid acyltransferase family protein [Bdellovibrionales bacterium]|nr:lysophospholipid acyltransferase family protein [Bdellovibrionales bacterium]
MLRDFLKFFFRQVIRLFYRRIEFHQTHRIPDGAAVFALNHVNALVDPGLLVCFQKRPISFLAKSTLFKIPVIGWIVKGLGCIPVFRKQDGENSRDNLKTFQLVADLLSGGGAMAIFPEGTSHDEHRLKPIKSGAVRMAMSAATRRTEPVWIVPGGLFYTNKVTFRSEVLVIFGEPMQVPSIPESDPTFRETMKQLNQELEARIRKLILEADDSKLLELYRFAEKIWTVHNASDIPSLKERYERRKQIQSLYEHLGAESPERLKQFRTRIEALYERYRHHDSQWVRFTNPKRDTAGLFLQFSSWFFLAPFGLIGGLLHFPIYLITGLIAWKMARGEKDMVITIQIFATLVLFPLFWVLLSASVWMQTADAGDAVALFLIHPLSAWIGLQWIEWGIDMFRGFRLLALRQFPTETDQNFENELRQIYQEIEWFRKSSSEVS